MMPTREDGFKMCDLLFVVQTKMRFLKVQGEVRRLTADFLSLCLASSFYLNLGKSAENGVSTTYEALSGALSSV